jgi:diaminopimelate epimerase
MIIHFSKYQGTGNDFVILDNRKMEYPSLTASHIRHLCDRRFGIGGDGLMMLNQKNGHDFEMKYYNADGRESSMCGNGGRCLVKFAYELGIHKNVYHFIAADGLHEAEIDTNGTVSLKMQDVNRVSKFHGDYLLNTGSPHYVKLVNDVMNTDVYKKGKEIRYSKDFTQEGVNVNFVEQMPDEEKILVRTYERGVEDETWSCGTGVVASALICFHNERGFNDVQVKTLGGTLTVEFDRIDDDNYNNIWLSGAADKVFEGTIEI